MSNDILWLMEKQQIIMVVILDLSAAIAMVDHNILLKILQNHYGITHKALQWLQQLSMAWTIQEKYREQILHTPRTTL